MNWIDFGLVQQLQAASAIQPAFGQAMSRNRFNKAEPTRRPQVHTASTITACETSTAPGLLNVIPTTVETANFMVDADENQRITRKVSPKVLELLKAADE